MNHLCTVCGSSWGRAVADAAALGIPPALLRSTYTCCQITQWALEQQLAWAEAAQDQRRVAEQDETEEVLVPVRLRQSQTARLRDRETHG